MSSSEGCWLARVAFSNLIVKDHLIHINCSENKNTVNVISDGQQMQKYLSLSRRSVLYQTHFIWKGALASSFLCLLIDVYLVGAYSLAVTPMFIPLIVNFRMSLFYQRARICLTFILKEKHLASNSTLNSYIEGQNNLSRNYCPMPHNAAVEDCVWCSSLQ